MYDLAPSPGVGGGGGGGGGYLLLKTVSERIVVGVW